jgi:hypothetical protein
MLAIHLDDQTKDHRAAMTVRRNLLGRLKGQAARITLVAERAAGCRRSRRPPKKLVFGEKAAVRRKSFPTGNKLPVGNKVRAEKPFGRLSEGIKHRP